jgi:hypothetical protein
MARIDRQMQSARTAQTDERLLIHTIIFGGQIEGRSFRPNNLTTEIAKTWSLTLE